MLRMACNILFQSHGIARLFIGTLEAIRSMKIHIRCAIKTILLIMFIVAPSYSYACATWGEGYYIADPSEFEIQDYYKSLFAGQNYISRIEYLNKMYGVNGWVESNYDVNISAPGQVENIKNVRVSIDLTSLGNMQSNVTVIMEKRNNKHFAYHEIIKYKKYPNVNYYATSIKIPGTVTIFAVLKNEADQKYLISTSQNIKFTGHCYYLTVRTQKEANRLNKKICDRVPDHNKKSKRACLELDKYYKQN